MQHQGCVVKINGQIIKADRPLHPLLGDTIDLQWNSQTGQLTLSPSKQTHLRYQLTQNGQKISGLPFRYSNSSPFLDPNIQTNPQRTMKPCAVGLVQQHQSNTILATQRPINLTFGGTWVLPGGHLERGQTIVEGGVRQCMQQVGLTKQAIVGVDHSFMMAWQSVFAAKGKIRATALVLFFKIQCRPFQVCADPKQIQRWEWRQLQEGQPWGGGWAQGHLMFLREYQKHLHQVRDGKN